jgi:cytochrome c oxidase cbb3-type subunit III
MSSRCRTECIVLLAALAFGACHRENRYFATPPDTDIPPAAAPMSPLLAGERSSALRAEREREYLDNAYHVSEGKRLYSWFNCTGCHAHGGGASGPPLMDDEWIYGGEIDHIYLTIVQGRPNGMPSFAAKIPAEQVWQLAAYVRSMGGHGPKAARPGRDDHLQIPAEQGRRDEPATPAPAPPAGS